MLFGAALFVSGCAGPVPVDEETTRSIGAQPSVPPADVFSAGIDPMRTDDGLWLSWSLRDRRSGRMAGSTNAATERTNAESTIKAWIALDHLRRADAAGRRVAADDAQLISASIRASDDTAAERLYRSAGADQVIRDLQPECGVDVSTARRGYWSFTQVTATDAVRILDCVLDRAPRYAGGTGLVADLHHVAPDGAFGIPTALGPTTSVAVKNGWTRHDAQDTWNVNCVASWSHYTLAVLTRFPLDRHLKYGEQVCSDVAGAVVSRLSDP